MILCLDLGNTHIFGGVFQDEAMLITFRYASNQVGTSDQYGLFLKNVLRENAIDPAAIKHIVLSSVVTSLDYSIISACIKYFTIQPIILRPGIKTGLKLSVKNPLEVGADRIANAIAAVAHFPNRNILVWDFGTASTCTAISANKEYLGGAILPGLRIAMQSLHLNTNRLFPVEIITPEQTLGKSTEHNIQSGIYFGHLGAVKEITANLTREVFSHMPPVIIGTGGFAPLFRDERIFDTMIPDLILHGLRLVLEKNCPG
jgi:type III pantothenate kinase